MNAIKKTKKNSPISLEEKALLESFEKGEWGTVKNLLQEKQLAKQAASDFLRKDARTNIRVSRD